MKTKRRKDDGHGNELPVSQADTMRLIQEMAEKLGTRAEGLSRLGLLELLRRVTDAGIEALAEQEKTVSFEAAAWASVEVRNNRRSTTCRDLRHFVRRMLRVAGVAELPLRGMKREECSELLQKAFGNSLHSYRKGKAILHSIFAFGIRQGWCNANPVKQIETPRIKESSISPLTPQEARKMMNITRAGEKRKMRFSLYLMMYCGVRPAEVCRIVPERDILWNERLLIIRPESSKTGGGRTIPMRLFDKMQLRRNECTIPADWSRRWKSLRVATGFHRWKADTLRHTFATYHAMYFRNLPQLQQEMGHRDAELLRFRYVLAGAMLPAQVFWQGCRTTAENPFSTVFSSVR